MSMDTFSHSRDLMKNVGKNGGEGGGEGFRWCSRGSHPKGSQIGLLIKLSAAGR